MIIFTDPCITNRAIRARVATRHCGTLLYCFFNRSFYDCFIGEWDVSDILNFVRGVVETERRWPASISTETLNGDFIKIQYF